MIRCLTAIACATACWATQPAASAKECPGCTKTAAAGEGFCCGKGKAFGVTLTSKKLYQALQGEDVSDKAAADCPCKTCRKIVRSNAGACDACQFTGGKRYSSPVAFALAKGKRITPELVASCPKNCDDCKTAFGKGTKCEPCGVAFAADRMFASDKDHQAAKAALKTLRQAAKAAESCEQCAVAMVTDGKCKHCNVKFKNGKVATAHGH